MVGRVGRGWARRQRPTDGQHVGSASPWARGPWAQGARVCETLWPPGGRGGARPRVGTGRQHAGGPTALRAVSSPARPLAQQHPPHTHAGSPPRGAGTARRLKAPSLPEGAPCELKASPGGMQRSPPPGHPMSATRAAPAPTSPAPLGPAAQAREGPPRPPPRAEGTPAAQAARPTAGTTAGTTAGSAQEPRRPGTRPSPPQPVPRGAWPPHSRQTAEHGEPGALLRLRVSGSRTETQPGRSVRGPPPGAGPSPSPLTPTRAGPTGASAPPPAPRPPARACVSAPEQLMRQGGFPDV